MGMISVNSIIPGFATMISNLVMSFSEGNFPFLELGRIRPGITGFILSLLLLLISVQPSESILFFFHPESQIYEGESDYYREYTYGMGQEIYMVDFSSDIHKIYIGRSYRDVCSEIYLHYG